MATHDGNEKEGRRITQEEGGTQGEERRVRNRSRKTNRAEMIKTDTGKGKTESECNGHRKRNRNNREVNTDRLR